MVGSRLEPGAAAVCFRLPVVFGTSRRYQQRRVAGLSMPVMRTQVGIVGAGPAGLVVSQLRDRGGIESVVLGNRDREYVTQSVRAFESDAPRIEYTHNGERHEIQCDVIAGCDGFHGVCRPAIESRLRIHNHEYPFGWLGILATVPPSTDELIYTNHERGFALHSLRSPELSRLYIQCDPRDDIANWSHERIWDEMHQRFATDDGWTLNEGPIVEKGITP